MSGKSKIGRIDLSDAKCFQAIYQEYFVALKYFACRYIKDVEVVCDLLQNLFVKLWEQGEAFENEAAFKTYLYHAVRNVCLTYIRDTQRKEAQLATYEPEYCEESFINQIIESEVYALVNEVFEELSPASREVYMKSLEGKSHKEIAEELNIAINTIKKHKNNANHYLRARLEKLLCLMVYIG